MPTRQAPRVSPGCCRHQVTSRPQPTLLTPPRGGPRPTPWHLSGETGFSAPKQIQLPELCAKGPAGPPPTFHCWLMCILQLGGWGGAVAAPGLGFLTSSAALQNKTKKKKHKNPGSFLNQPSGVPQRDEERDREAERQRERETGEMKLRRRDRKRQEREETDRDRVDGRRKRRTGQTRRGGERQDRRRMPSIHSAPNQASWGPFPHC